MYYITKMDYINSQKKKFVSEFKHYIEDNIELNQKIYGISVAPLHIYGVADSKLTGLPCVVLGRERDGIYTDKLNFFGGKFGDKNLEGLTKAESIATVLFEEMLEEMGYILNSKCFEKSIVKILTPSIYDGVSLVFLCHITGISREKWKEIMTDRLKDDSLEWKYQEMSQIEHVPVEEISSRKDLSVYVKQNLYSIIPAVKLLNRDNLVYIGNFKNTIGIKL